MIQVAPMFPLSYVDNENLRSSTKRSEPFHALYIASEDGFVDLRIICTVSKNHLGHAQRAGELTTREQEHLRVKLLHWFARPALEDEVTRQLAVIDELVRKKMPKATLDSELCHLFLALTDDSVELLVVHRGNPRSDLVALIDEVARKATAAGARTVTCRHKCEAEVTLAEIEGMMRFAFDYLSFYEPTNSSWRAFLGQ
jgi:hypothetical protein